MTATTSWRDVLPVHPAAELFPMMSESELRELGNDIKKSWLRNPIDLWRDPDGKVYLLDGRNRLDAMDMVGISLGKAYYDLFSKQHGQHKLSRTWPSNVDPYDFVLSANINRRHLTAEQKRQLIADLVKAKPEASDRQIAKQTKSSPTTVGAVRKDMEKTGDVSKLDTRTDTKGRKQPATKPKKTATAKLNGQPVDVAKLGTKAQEVIEVETRRAQMAALDEPQPVASGSVKGSIVLTKHAEKKIREATERLLEPGGWLGEPDSGTALRSFKKACDNFLPLLNKDDAAKARVYFNEWTAKVVKAEAKANAAT